MTLEHFRHADGRATLDSIRLREPEMTSVALSECTRQSMLEMVSYGVADEMRNRIHTCCRTVWPANDGRLGTVLVLYCANRYCSAEQQKCQQSFKLVSFSERGTKSQVSTLFLRRIQGDMSNGNHPFSTTKALRSLDRTL